MSRKKKRRTRLEIAKEIFDAMIELEEVERKRDEPSKVWLDGQDVIKKEFIKEAHKHAEEQALKEAKEKEKVEATVE